MPTVVWVSPVVGVDGTVYAGAVQYKELRPGVYLEPDFQLYAINPNGSLKWSYKAEGSGITSPAVDAKGTIYVGSDDTLYALNPDGYFKWGYKTRMFIVSSPAIGADETIYVGSYDHKLYAIGQTIEGGVR